jgi:hypothetical protein
VVEVEVFTASPAEKHSDHKKKGLADTAHQVPQQDQSCKPEQYPLQKDSAFYLEIRKHAAVSVDKEAKSRILREQTI